MVWSDIKIYKNQTFTLAMRKGYFFNYFKGNPKNREWIFQSFQPELAIEPI
jgi:hypothetical protein